MTYQHGATITSVEQLARAISAVNSTCRVLTGGPIAKTLMPAPVADCAVAAAPMHHALFAPVEFKLQLAIGEHGQSKGQWGKVAGLSLTPDDQYLLAADIDNKRVAVLRASDGSLIRYLGGLWVFENPANALVVPSTGEVLVADRLRQKIFRFRSISDDTLIGTLGTGNEGSGVDEFKFPQGMVLLEGRHSPAVCLRQYL
jgi:hypothetical protein